MREYNLEPKFDGHKSFYGKAKVVENENSVSLVSYKSCICQILENGLDDVTVIIRDVHDYYGNSLTFSRTSLSHLKEFLKQNGLEAKSKAQIMKDYNIVYGGNTDAESWGYHSY